jgi:ABC-type transporter Mla MlaB component
MKTTKRKRSTAAAKTQPGVVASDLAAAAAEVTPVVEVAIEPIAVVEAVAAAPAPVAASVSETTGEPVIVLAANCSVKDAAALKVSLSAVVQESTAVTLDTSAVERIDTATMQLLCAFVRDRSGRNQRVTWLGESQVLQDAARLLGVRALLGFDEAKGVAA